MRLPSLTAVSLAALTALAAPAAARALAAGGHDARAKRSAAGYDHLEATTASRVVPAVAGGAAANRITVKPGDSPTASGERTEMVWSQADTDGFAGAAVTYRWSARFPSGFGYVKGSTWNIFTQFHETASDDCHPNLALQINAKGPAPLLRLQARGGRLGPACEPAAAPSWDFAPLQFDHRYDFSLKVRWSANPDEGCVQLKVDGRTAIPLTRTPTLYPGQGVYLKQGFYRAPSAFDSVLFETPPVITPVASSASYKR